jgi:hypothetical protein
MEPLIKREWSREYWEIRGASAHQAGKTEGRTCASAMLLWLVVVTVCDTLSDADQCHPRQGPSIGEPGEVRGLTGRLAVSYLLPSGLLHQSPRLSAQQTAASTAKCPCARKQGELYSRRNC